MQGSHEPTDAMDREQLAKAWLLRLVERTSLRDAGDLSLAWLASEAPPLIAAILAEVGGAQGSANGVVTGPAQTRRDAGTDPSFSHIARLRSGPGAAELLPRDLATLQALLIEALQRQVPDAGDDFAAATRELAELFGTIQADVARSLVERQATGTGHDDVTGLPGAAQLNDWIHALVAEQRRYRHPFALALIDIEGLERINDAYGRSAGDSMLATVAGVIRRQVRGSDRAFRLEHDELCVLAPHSEPEGLLPVAQRLAGLLARSQQPEGPRLAITVGIAGCPRDGDSAERLLDAAEEATYAAKAAGEGVATATRAAMQDR